MIYSARKKTFCENFCRLPLPFQRPFSAILAFFSVVKMIHETAKTFALFSLPGKISQAGKKEKIHLFSITIFIPTSHKHQFYVVTRGFTRLNMKIRYVCHGLISSQALIFVKFTGKIFAGEGKVK